MMFKKGDRVRFKRDGKPQDWALNHRYCWTIISTEKMFDDDGYIFHLKRRHDGEIRTRCTNEPENLLELA